MGEWRRRGTRPLGKVGTVPFRQICPSVMVLSGDTGLGWAARHAGTSTVGGHRPERADLTAGQ